VVDGLGVHIPKGYVYAAIGFSVLIEALNQAAARNRRKHAASSPRQRLAEAVLSLLGGVPLSDAALSTASESGSSDALIPNTTHRSVFAPGETRMVGEVLTLSNRAVHAIMTPRDAVDWLDALESPASTLARVRASPHREFPVGRGGIESVLGLVRKDDILSSCLEGHALALDQLMRKPVIVPASLSVLGTLDLFKGTTDEMMVVQDGSGTFLGVITLTDLLEAIAGEMPDRGDEPDVHQLSDGSFSIDARTSLSDLQAQLKLGELPNGDYETAAGFIAALLGHPPKQGEHVEWAGIRFEVAALDREIPSRIIARPPGLRR
jgi:CBS domain containing-hemolysin-like protein